MKLLSLIVALFLVNISCLASEAPTCFNIDPGAVIKGHYPRCGLGNLDKIVSIDRTNPLPFDRFFLAAARATKAKVMFFSEILANKKAREYLQQGEADKFRNHEIVCRLLPNVLETERELVASICPLRGLLGYTEKHYNEKTYIVFEQDSSRWFNAQFDNYAGRIEDFENTLSVSYHTLIQQLSVEEIVNIARQEWDRIRQLNIIAKQDFMALGLCLAPLSEKTFMALGLYLELCGRLEPDAMPRKK